MKILRRTALILLLAALFSGLLPVMASEPEPIDIEAKASLLVDVNTGLILHQENIHEKLYPASLTKIMTALLAIENGTLTDMVTVSSRAYSNLDPDGSTVSLVPGEQMSLENLLYCLMVASANEASNVIAEYIAGDIDSFVEMMNAKAAELGCENTHYVNPHGLHDPDHYTTAWDTYLITREAMKYPIFLEICNTTSKEIPATNESDSRFLMTTNYLLSNQKVTGYVYSPACGVKTGHTTDAGFCLVSTAAKNDMTLLSVVLGAKSVIHEGDITEIQSFSETARLFEWGFASYSIQTLVNDLEPVAELPVALAADVDVVALKPSGTISGLVPTEYDEDDLYREITLYSDELSAPIEAGEVLGELSLYYDNRLLGVTYLVALTDVAMSTTQYYSEYLRSFLSQTYVKVIVAVAAVILLTVIVLVALSISRKKRRRTAMGGTYKGSSLKKFGRK